LHLRHLVPYETPSSLHYKHLLSIKESSVYLVGFVNINSAGKVEVFVIKILSQVSQTAVVLISPLVSLQGQILSVEILFYLSLLQAKQVYLFFSALQHLQEG